MLVYGVAETLSIVIDFENTFLQRCAVRHRALASIAFKIAACYHTAEPLMHAVTF